MGFCLHRPLGRSCYMFTISISFFCFQNILVFSLPTDEFEEDLLKTISNNNLHLACKTLGDGVQRDCVGYRDRRTFNTREGHENEEMGRFMFGVSSQDDPEET